MKKVSTFFSLMAEFGSSEIELELISEKYFGLGPAKAKRAACLHNLPIPAHKGGSQKSSWLVNAADLAQFIDTLREQAQEEWNRKNNIA